MTPLDEERIRRLAYALSEDPARSACSTIDNWLEAERLLAAGLGEDESVYGADVVPTGAVAPAAPAKEPVVVSD